jgi:hypothetical protein
LTTSPGLSARARVTAGASSTIVPVKRSGRRRATPLPGSSKPVHAGDRKLGGHRGFDVQDAALAIEDDGKVMRVSEAELAGKGARDAVL